MILDKISYISTTEEILNGHTKFSNLDIPAGKEINYITNLKKRIISDLKLLKDQKIIDNAIYKNIKLVRSRPSVLHGLGKVHKETKNGLPPFRFNFVSYWSAIFTTIFDAFIFTTIFDAF